MAETFAYETTAPPSEIYGETVAPPALTCQAILYAVLPFEYLRIAAQLLPLAALKGRLPKTI